MYKQAAFDNCLIWGLHTNIALFIRFVLGLFYFQPFIMDVAACVITCPVSANTINRVCISDYRDQGTTARGRDSVFRFVDVAFVRLSAGLPFVQFIFQAEAG